jgi:beta-phosphoglucomutase-like phosphatase (HAD superfamily)
LRILKAPILRRPPFFDLDGTLIDTVYEAVLAWSAALKGAGMLMPNWHG